MTTVLSREAIFAVDDRLIEFVRVPEWSGDNPDAGVFVRGLSGTDRDAFEMAMFESRKDAKSGKTTQEVNFQNLRAKLIVRCAVDAEDPNIAKPIFTLRDIAPLGLKSAAALQRVYSVAQRLSGLSTENVDELTSELGNDPSDGSGSDSLDTSAYPSLNASNESAAESSQSGSLTTD